jgi:hypothetical protein
MKTVLLAALLALTATLGGCSYEHRVGQVSIHLDQEQDL